LESLRRERQFSFLLLLGPWDKWSANCAKSTVSPPHCVPLIGGLRVVGSAGDDEKVEFLLKELNFDAAFNYKKERPKDAIPKLCPDGIGSSSLDNR